jgi:hypothetical protein
MQSPLNSANGSAQGQPGRRNGQSVEQQRNLRGAVPHRGKLRVHEFIDIDPLDWAAAGV